MTCKCLNMFCDNLIPDYRSAKQNDWVSKNQFCVKCLRYEKRMFQWVCVRDDCDNIISWNSHLPRKYCSDICYNRNKMKTPVKKINICEICNNDFFPKFQARQRFCSVKCNNKYTSIRRKEERFIKRINNIVS